MLLLIAFVKIFDVRLHMLCWLLNT